MGKRRTQNIVSIWRAANCGEWFLKRTVGAVSLAVDAKDTDGSLMTRSLFGQAQDPFVIVTPSDPLDGGREFPHLQALSAGNVPKSHLVVCGPGDQELGLSCHTDGEVVSRPYSLTGLSAKGV